MGAHTDDRAVLHLHGRDVEAAELGGVYGAGCEGGGLRHEFAPTRIDPKLAA
jgi:hypothetical protein